MEDNIVKLIFVLAALFLGFLIAVTAKLWETFKKLDKEDDDGER